MPGSLLLAKDYDMALVEEDALAVLLSKGKYDAPLS